MGKVVLDMAMSLDGFIAGTNDEDGGLHDYFFAPSDATAQVIEAGFKTIGAIIMGRRTYNIGAAQGGFANDPYQVPTFVLSSDVPQKLATGAEAFVFVSDGMESALKQAKAAAGDRDIVVGGGAKTAQEFLRAGLIEEIHIHLIPVLLGTGKPLFDSQGSAQHKLERMQVVDAPDVTHLRFRIVT